ncbi:MAG: hypothetical protein GY741_12335, partial [Phycisphaeraceae bacterium]|nr:hypothetical protein [Phycisphaeraceae bacterium]
ALVVAMWSNKYDAGGNLTEEADRLENVDGDFSGRSLTDFGTRGLFEIVDTFGNPIAYIHRRDYEKKDRRYMTIDPESGEELQSAPRAFYNEKLGQYFAYRKYQLISAGPDAEFGNEDDITAFERD